MASRPSDLAYGLDYQHDPDYHRRHHYDDDNNDKHDDQSSTISTITTVLTSPTSWLGRYDDFIARNSGQVSQIESALRSLTYIIPGERTSCVLARTRPTPATQS